MKFTQGPIDFPSRFLERLSIPFGFSSIGLATKRFLSLLIFFLTLLLSFLSGCLASRVRSKAVREKEIEREIDRKRERDIRGERTKHVIFSFLAPETRYLIGVGTLVGPSSIATPPTIRSDEGLSTNRNTA